MSEYFPAWSNRWFKNQRLTNSQKRKLLELYAKADEIREKAQIDAEIEWKKADEELNKKLDDIF